MGNKSVAAVTVASVLPWEGFEGNNSFTLSLCWNCLITVTLQDTFVSNPHVCGTMWTHSLLCFPLGRSCLNYQAQETKSSLSKTLEQVLQDSVALPYFIQFMELRRMEHLVKFWLEAESFHSTTWSRIRAHSLNTVKQSSLAEPVSPSKQQELASSPPAGWLEERLEGSGTARLLQPEPDRTASSQNHVGLPGQGSHSSSALCLSKPETGTQSLPADQQESSKLSVSNRNSPSSALKDLSGKLMKSKFCVFPLVKKVGNGECFCCCCFVQGAASVLRCLPSVMWCCKQESFMYHRC